MPEGVILKLALLILFTLHLLNVGVDVNVLTRLRLPRHKSNSTPLRRIFRKLRFRLGILLLQLLSLLLHIVLLGIVLLLRLLKPRLVVVREIRLVLVVALDALGVDQIPEFGKLLICRNNNSRQLLDGPCLLFFGVSRSLSSVWYPVALLLNVDILLGGLLFFFKTFSS